MKDRQAECLAVSFSSYDKIGISVQLFST